MIFKNNVIKKKKKLYISLYMILPTSVKLEIQLLHIQNGLHLRYY